MLAIKSQTITEKVGVTVTQGSVTGILKTALTGVNSQSIVIETTQDAKFITTADIVIGSTTVAHANVDTATRSQITTVDSSKIVASTNNGATTKVVIRTVAGVEFRGSDNLNIAFLNISYHVYVFVLENVNQILFFPNMYDFHIFHICKI